MRTILPLFLFLFGYYPIFAQNKPYTLADTLRGMLRPERTCYDVKYYELRVDIDFVRKSIKGLNKIEYMTTTGANMLQIDLFANMRIDKILHQGKICKYHRKHNAVFVDLGEIQPANVRDSLLVYFSGKPTSAIRPPWDGGFSWEKDEKGRDWLGVACEGLGASVWFPNKDYLGDEPDSVRIIATVPKPLVCVSNGVLRGKQEDKKKITYDWFVSYPINNYNITLNVGHYLHFSDTFVSTIDSQKLALDYYVIDYNKEVAEAQFKETHTTLRVMEKYLDKYPFWNDGFALVETHYLGMEHQGAIAYGNKFMKGYRGMFPIGMPFDYIIMHEAAHEWWGNSIGCKDHAELWIHETFTTYMESVYVEEVYGAAKTDEYFKYQVGNIANTQPMIGDLDVNYNEHNSDIYYKGALMLHTLRTSVNNDSIWWGLLKTFYQKHAMSQIVTQTVVDFVNEYLQADYTVFFKQYLYQTTVPTLQYKLKQKGDKVEISAKFKNALPNFSLKVGIFNQNSLEVLDTNTEKWANLTIKNANVRDIKLKMGLYRVEFLD